MPLIDFAIVTGLKEEFEAIKKVFPPLTLISENSSVWYRTTIMSDDNQRRFHVVLSYQDTLGSFNAITLTRSIINRWDPAYIILPGIAGTFHEKVKLGDVIVSQQIFHYDLGKAVDQGKQVKIQYRPQGYPCSITLIRQAEAVSIDAKGWITKATRSAKNKARKIRSLNLKKHLRLAKELESHRPTVHFGTVASGSLVVTSQKKKKELLALHGKILGIEMEGAGVMHAAYYEELPVPAVVVKAISDSADANKGKLDELECWREIALENSSQFVLQLISSGKIRPLQTDEFQINPVADSPTLARDRIKDSITPGNSLLSFPTLIIPQGPLTGISIEIVVSGEDSGLRVVKLYVDYISKGKNQNVIVTSGKCEISGPIAQAPIGVYFLVSGKIESSFFHIKTFALEKRDSWTPNK